MSPVKRKKRQGNIPFTSKVLDTTITQTILDIFCEDCDWERPSTGNHNADRVAGRRHAEQHQHLVKANVTRSIEWDGR